MITVRPIQLVEQEILAVATILVAGFAGRSDAWPTVTHGVNEVMANSTDAHVSLVATVDELIVGWVSAVPQYQSTGWELHPLVVAPQFQRRGFGHALIEHLCAVIAHRGATVLYAWSDDESQSTSLGNVDLYPNPLLHLTTFQPSQHHAGGFYLAQQFCLCGVIPDANGHGKPDILFARRIV